MKPSAIVYTSNTGYTAEYARMLGDKTGLPVYELSHADELKKGTPILYLGWLFANNVKGYKKAAKKFQITAVCGVGLCDTGTMQEEVQKANSLPESTPLFTIQGGMNHAKLYGINKMMIRMLVKHLKANTDRTKEEERALELVIKGGNYVSEENLAAVMAWYQR